VWETARKGKRQTVLLTLHAGEPTTAAIARHQKLRAQLKGILTRLDTVLNQDLGAFSKAVADAGIPPVILVPSNKPH